ncbi:MAG: adenylate kinase [Candidatus Atribacteria bacterium]|nr:adenylate kinase [Candidatus Atribacteria bacterium]
MIIILLGPPGAGKGTIAVEIKKKIDIPVISTGDILRNAIQDGTKLGQEAQDFVNSGKLVPDFLIMKIIENRIIQQDCNHGFIFDGFPRTIHQAQEFDSISHQLKKKIDQVFYFEASHEVIIERLSSRRVCSQCGMIYNLNYNPPRIQGKCDQCGGALIQRDDDQVDTIEKRLKVYQNDTLPLVHYYQGKKLLTTINADQDVQDRFKEVWEKLTELNLVGEN